MALAVKVYEAFKEDEKKAKVLLEVIEELEARVVPNIATKDDVELAKLALKKEIEEVKLSLQKEIVETKASIVKWVTGLMVVQTGVILTMITILQ